MAVLWVSMAKCTIHVNWFTYCENTARISPSVSPWSRPPAHRQRELGCVVKKLTLPQSHYFQHTHNHNGLMNQPLTMSVSSLYKLIHKNHIQIGTCATFVILLDEMGLDEMV